MPSRLPTIVAAVIRRGRQLVLVEEQGPDDSEPVWMLPGGRAEEGEDPLAAIHREVAEETGLAVVGRPRIAFAVEVALDTDLHVGTYRAVTYACEASGHVQPDDPDGLVLRAEWVNPTDALVRLARVQWYECEPLRRFLAGEAPATARYRYAVTARHGDLIREALEIIA
jgi:8-oxo-dGTP diphosphatase